MERFMEGDGFGHQRGVDLWAVDLIDLDVDLPAHTPLDLLLEPIHLGALLADDNPGTARGDGDGQLLAGPLQIDARHAGMLQALLELRTKLQILVEELLVFLLGEPAGFPILVESYPETHGIYFLTQRSPPKFSAEC
jgi:hypothetical protein